MSAVDSAYDLILKFLFEDHLDETVTILIAAIVSILVFYFLINPMIMAIVNDEEKVRRWKPVTFFVTSMIMMTLLYLMFVPETSQMFPEWIYVSLVVSAVSAAMYYIVPKTGIVVKRLSLKDADDGDKDKGSNKNNDSNNKEEGDND